MKHARKIPLALFAACLVASTPFSWAAGRDAAAADGFRLRPRPIPARVLEVVDFVAGAAGMLHMPLPKVFFGEILPSDVGNADASSESSSVSSRAKAARLLAPVDPIETANEYSVFSSR